MTKREIIEIIEEDRKKWWDLMVMFEDLQDKTKNKEENQELIDLYSERWFAINQLYHKITN